MHPRVYPYVFVSLVGGKGVSSESTCIYLSSGRKNLGKQIWFHWVNHC